MTRTDRFQAKCKEMGVRVHFVDKATDSHQTGQDIYVPRDLESSRNFWPAMHELGHVATGSKEYDADTCDPFSFFPFPGTASDAYILEEETRATKWALENAGEKPDADAYRCLDLALRTYVADFRHTFGKPGAEALVEDIWKGNIPSGLNRNAHDACTMPADVKALDQEWQTKGKASKLTAKELDLQY